MEVSKEYLLSPRLFKDPFFKKYRTLEALLLRCISLNDEDFSVSFVDDDNFFLMLKDGLIVEFVLDEDTLTNHICTKNVILEGFSCEVLDSNAARIFVNHCFYLIEEECDRFAKNQNIEVNWDDVLDSFYVILRCSSGILTRCHICAILENLFLLQYKVDIDFNTCCELNGNAIWSSITSDKVLTVVDYDTVAESFLKEHVASVIGTKSGNDLYDLYKSSWLSNEVSLLLRVNSSEDFMNVVNILEVFNLNLRVTVLRLCDSKLRNVKLKVFQHVDDLCEEECELISRLKLNVRVKLKEVLSLSEIRSLSCLEVIHMLSAARQFNKTQPYCIDRTFTRVILNSYVLIGTINENFVIKCKSGVLQLSVSKKPTSVHHLINNDGNLEWINSCGDLSNIRNYKISDVNTSCDFAEVLTNERSIIIIESECGMGKSTLLNRLISNLPENYWVHIINLREYCDEFIKLKMNFALYFTYQLSKGLNLVTQRLFYRLLKLKRIWFVIDGFDEVFSDFGDVALSLMKLLKKWKFKLLVMVRTSRVHILEKHLGTLAFKLNPFNNENRKEFLTKYLARVCNVRVQEYVAVLLNTLQNAIGSAFISSPLHLKIIGDIFAEDCKGSLLVGNINVKNTFNLLQFLEAFVKEYMHLFCIKYKHVGNIVKYFEHYSLLALKYQFDADDLSLLKIDMVMKNYLSRDVLNEEGFTAIFKYNIIVEYLSALWIYNNLTSRGSVGDVVSLLMSRRFCDVQRFRNVFKLLDYILAEDCPMHTALINGHFSIVKAELQFNSILEQDKGGRNIVHIAALYGLYHPKDTNVFINTYDEMAEIVTLSDKTLYDAKDSLLGHMPLDYAIGYGTLAVAKVIIEKFPNMLPNIHIDNSDLESYYQYCINIVSYKPLSTTFLIYTLCSMLYQKQIEVCSTISSFISNLPLNDLVQSVIENQLDVLELTTMMEFLENFDLKFENRFVYSNLNLTSAFGAKEDVKKLLLKGARINNLGNNSLTPLHVAVIHKRLDIIEMLLSFGAKINIADGSGNTPLHLACQNYCNLIIVEKLLQCNADVNLRNMEGDLPLHCALKNDLPDIADLFLPPKWYQLRFLPKTLIFASSVELNVQNKVGDTPLLLAIKYNHMSIASKLLNYVDTKVENAMAHSCLHNAVENHNSKFVLQLCCNKFDINAISSNGSPLQLALNSKQIDIAYLLISSGANFDDCLHDAIKSGNEEIVSKILHNGADINKQNIDGLTPLLQAIDSGHSNIAALLVKNGANVHLMDHNGRSAVYSAVSKNYRRLLSLLYLEGADVNKSTNDGDVPLVCAAKSYYYTIFKMLISFKADVNCSDGNGWSPLHAIIKSQPSLIDVLLQNDVNAFAETRDGHSCLHFAAQVGSVEAVTKLVNVGLDVNKRTNDGNTPILCNVIEYPNRPIIELLVKNGADINITNSTGNCCLHYLASKAEDTIIEDFSDEYEVNIQNNEGHTPLHLAVKNRNSSTTKLLLTKGADVNIIDYRNNNSCLHWAVNVADQEIVKILLDNGADVGLLNSTGETPLMFAERLQFNNIVSIINQQETFEKCKDLFEAVENGHVYTVQTLVNNGLDINSQNENGETLLLIAIRCVHIPIMDWLISKGAKIDIVSNRSSSALHFAACMGDCVSVRCLIEGGVDVNILNSDGDTAIALALRHEKISIAEILLDHNAEIYVTPPRNFKHSCLHYAVKSGSEAIVLRILESGYNVDKVNADATTALHEAIYCKNFNLVQLLIKHGANVNIEVQNESYLDKAISCNMIDLVKMLLFKGARLHKINVGNNGTPLVKAVIENKRSIAKLLIENGADVHVRDIWGEYILHSAVRNGFDEIIEDILDSGFDIDKKSDEEHTALRVAVHNGDIDVVELLISKGACITNDYYVHIAIENKYIELALKFIHDKTRLYVKDIFENTPLHSALMSESVFLSKLLLKDAIFMNYLDDEFNYTHYAAKLGNSDLLSTLLEYGFDIDEKDDRDETPLTAALSNCNFATARFLLSKGADPKIYENEYFSVLYCVEDGENDLLLIMIQKGVNLNLQNSQGVTALMSAIEKEQYTTVKLLLENGADANLIDNQGKTALRYAVDYYSKTHTFETIVLKTNNINMCAQDKKSPLIAALENSKLEFVKILLKHNADCVDKRCIHYSAENGLIDILESILSKVDNINDLDEMGNSALLLALKNERDAAAKMLLDHDANTNVINLDGFSCLHYAVYCSEELLLQFLVQHKQDVNMLNKSGDSPLLVALQIMKKSSVELLLKYGANVNIVNNEGFSCLHYAALCEPEMMSQFLCRDFLERKNNTGNTPLLVAIMNDRTDNILSLIQYGADLSARNNDGDTCMDVAINKGNRTVIKLLLDNGSDPHTINQHGETCILIAVESGDEVLAKNLLDKNVDMNVMSNLGYTPFLASLEKGHYNLAKLLITRGANVKIRRITGNNLHFAITQKVNVIQELLDAGLDIEMKDKDGNTPLLLAIKSGPLRIAKLLIEKGANIHVINNEGNSTLHYAVARNSQILLLDLIHRGVNIEHRNAINCTPVLLALSNNGLVLAQTLFHKGANYHTFDNEGNSCLHYAAMRGFNKVISESILHGMDIDKENYNQQTPLSLAFEYTKLSTVKMLLRRGAKVIFKNVIHHAMEFNDVELLKMLIDRGFDINRRMCDKDSILLYALRGEQKELADFLISEGANVHVISLQHGDSCLNLAAAAGFDDIVDYLISAGLDLNWTNHSKETPLRLALTNEKKSTATLLLSYGALAAEDNFRYSYLHYAAQLGDDIIAMQIIVQGVDLNRRNRDGNTPLILSLINENVSTAKLLLAYGADPMLTNKEGQSALYFAKIAEVTDLISELVQRGVKDEIL
ncbi:hypothetical protein FQA39_LY12550 [Lamprigera yunnana]|nr:hypothetical protein FQA39_LY12550 [Lamprigera yunnana]